MIQKILPVLLITLTSIIITGCMDSMHSGTNADHKKQNFSSEGERIYFTGQSNSGSIIKAINGQHHMNMHGGSCVTCHGADRKGGAIMWPRFWISAPSLTFDALAEKHEDDHSHASYDAKSLELAITKGIRPDGEQLHRTMPRWEMSAPDLEALVHFLLEADNHSHG